MTPIDFITSLQTLTPVLNADNVWVWNWLARLVGPQGAQTIQYLLMTAIYGFVLFLDFMQFIRFLQNMGNRNHEDAKIKAEARENIKTSIFIIATVTIIGGGGFTMLCIFMNNFIPVDNM